MGSNGGALTTKLNLRAPKNGYAFIYVSNQSNNDVYFDNFQVNIAGSNIIEENHYYAYGMKISTISGRRLGDNYEGLVKNNYLYNDKELFDDADLNWYDYGFRNYDAQIGRFTQLDPLTFNYPYYTPYQYAGCEPIANIDIDGLEPGYSLEASFAKATAEAANYAGTSLENFVVKAVKTKLPKVGASLGDVTRFTFLAANHTNNVLNTGMITRPVSESTCQNCNSAKPFLPPVIPYVQPTISSWTPIEAQKKKMDEAYKRRQANGGYDDSWMLEKIRRENIEIVENSPTNFFPVLGFIKKAGRYEVQYGYHDEALGALKDATIEAATYALPFGEIKTGTSLWPAASGGKTFINGIEYTTPALERMQPVGTIMKGTELFSRGVPPSVVENAIKFGEISPGNSASTVVRTFENVRVVTNLTGTRVVTVIKLGH